MFRKIDWLTLGVTFLVVWAVYLWTLAPELTLEDSGELCTGSFYAGIPHPPGYPFWAIYSWFWTAILPLGNVAWRVEVGESFAAAMGCGMLALMVSRGSSMLIEGIEELKGIARNWENAICIVSGFVAGLLLGLGRFHVGRIRGHQPHFALRCAVVDCRHLLPDALGLCAAATAVSLSGHVSFRLAVRPFTKPCF